MDLLIALLWALVYILVACGIAALVLWVARKIAPEFYEPARLVIGLVVLIVVVLILIRVLTAGLP